MLDQCQSSDEVKTVLNGSCRKNPSGNGGSGFTRGSSVLPLVHTALRMEQKKVNVVPVALLLAMSLSRFDVTITHLCQINIYILSTHFDVKHAQLSYMLTKCIYIYLCFL